MKSLRYVGVKDIQAYLLSLSEKSNATRALALAAIKSLFSYAMGIGYIDVNPTMVVSLPKQSNTLSNRILSESDVHLMYPLPGAAITS